MQADLNCRPVLGTSVYQQPKRPTTDADYLGPVHTISETR